jgi:O-antigen ligase
MKNFFSIIYIAYLLVLLVYGNFHVGIIPASTFVSTLVIVVCISINNQLYADKYFKLYLFFVVCYLLSASVTGYIVEGTRRLLGFYFVCYCAYLSTFILVKKFNSIHVLLNTLLIIGALNTFVTIGQAYGLSYADRILDFLYIDKMAWFEELQESEIDVWGYYAPGMFTAVSNGYYMMTFTVLSLTLQREFGVKSIVGYFYTLFALYATFLTQERSAFLIAFFIVVIGLYKMMVERNKDFKPILLFFFILFVAWLIPYLYEEILSGDNRFSQKIGTEESRISIYNNALNYILDNPIFGGLDRFFALKIKAPHNLILNAYIYGGILGFIALVTLVFKQCKLCVRESLKIIKPDNTIYIVFSLAYLAYTANAMLHNSSLATGDSMVWLLWGGFYFHWQQSLKSVAK